MHTSYCVFLCIIFIIIISVFCLLYRILVGKPEGNSPLGRSRLRWSIILRRIPRKWDMGAWIGVMWLRIVTGGGHL